MILSWETHEHGAASLRAQVQEYDAFPPVDALLIDALPVERHPDREALAGYLAFGRWTSGDLVLPDGPSPLLAEAIEKDSLPVRVRPREVAYVPRRLPHGRRRVSVLDEIPPEPATEHVLVIAQSPLARGVFASGQQMIVPSNAFALGNSAPSRLRALLAVAVLFAADVDADVLRLSVEQVPPGEAARLAALLQCVNLELELS